MLCVCIVDVVAAKLFPRVFETLQGISWLTALEPLCMHKMLPETPHVAATLPLETVPIPFAMK